MKRASLIGAAWLACACSSGPSTNIGDDEPAQAPPATTDPELQAPVSDPASPWDGGSLKPALEGGARADATPASIDASKADAPANDAASTPTADAASCSAGASEVEPNDTTGTANPLAAGVCGTIAGNDVDYFTFDAQGIVRVTFTATGDARVTLRSPGGSTQSSNAPASMTTFAAITGTFSVRVEAPSGQAQSYVLRRQ